MTEAWWVGATDREVVEALCEIEEGMTTWEVSRADEWFAQVVDEGRPLSEGQRRKAEQILRERT